MKARKWRTIDAERVYATPIFDLYRRKAAHDYRGERNFYIIEAPGWVNIIPVTSGGEVVLVRQFRHGVSDFTLEIPGGMIDPHERDPAAAARREMIEESGYDADEIIPLGKVHPNPAIQPNWCYSFFAPGARKIGEPHPNHGGAEETEVVMAPLTDVKGMIATGVITHALVIAAFSFFDVYNPPPRRS